MTKGTILYDFTPEQLSSLFEGLQNQITDLKKSFEPVKPAEYLTIAEVGALLKCNRTTVYNLTKKGVLKSYGISNKVLYIRSEVTTSLIPLNKTA